MQTLSSKYAPYPYEPHQITTFSLPGRTTLTTHLPPETISIPTSLAIRSPYLSNILAHKPHPTPQMQLPIDPAAFRYYIQYLTHGSITCIPLTKQRQDHGLQFRDCTDLLFAYIAGEKLDRGFQHEVLHEVDRVLSLEQTPDLETLEMLVLEDAQEELWRFVLERMFRVQRLWVGALRGRVGGDKDRRGQVGGVCEKPLPVIPDVADGWNAERKAAMSLCECVGRTPRGSEGQRLGDNPKCDSKHGEVLPSRITDHISFDTMATPTIILSEISRSISGRSEGLSLNPTERLMKSLPAINSTKTKLSRPENSSESLVRHASLQKAPSPSRPYTSAGIIRKPAPARGHDWLSQYDSVNLVNSIWSR